MERYQVLVAEDEGALRSVIVQALSEAGLTVAEAADGLEAFRILRENPQPQTLLISDVRMPRMDGFELASAAIDFNSEIKILMLTAYAEMMVPPDALRAREVRVLRKPVDLDRLCELAMDMLARP